MTNEKKLIIIGAGGHGKVCADIALKMNRWEQIAFLDDDRSLQTVLGLQVIGRVDDAKNYVGDWDVFVAIGANLLREKIQSKLEICGATFPVLVHPNAIVGLDVVFGPGTSVMAGGVINCNTIIGKGCIVNTGATIDHDNVIENFVHISPGVNLAGNVRIGKGCWVGIGSTVSNNVEIVGNCLIGAGAVVIKDINEPGKYVGIPAAKINKE